MTNYAHVGRRREHLVIHELAKFGWVKIARSAGSKGPVDVVLAHEKRGVILVQVGGPDKTLGPEDRALICTYARLTNAWPILATVNKGGRIEYRHINTLTPRTWAEWFPGEIA